MGALYISSLFSAEWLPQNMAFYSPLRCHEWSTMASLEEKCHIARWCEAPGNVCDLAGRRRSSSATLSVTFPSFEASILESQGHLAKISTKTSIVMRGRASYNGERGRIAESAENEPRSGGPGDRRDCHPHRVYVRIIRKRSKARSRMAGQPNTIVLPLRRPLCMYEGSDSCEVLLNTLLTSSTFHNSRKKLSHFEILLN